MKERPSLSWVGYEPVALIGKEPEELAVRGVAGGRKLVFDERYDDLDRLRESTFVGASGATFGLVRYVHAKQAGTQLLVQARSLSQATELLDEAVMELHLTMPDLSWIRRELWAGMSAASEKREMDRKATADREKGRAQRGRGAKQRDASPRSAEKDAAVKPDAALAKVIGSGEMSRKEMTKKVWSYIKQKGLQDKRERRMINADDALRALFGGRQQVNMLELPALLEKHLKSKR